MHIAILTAGGAGMFCGSCMHDNTWARALMQSGAEVTLIPTYTPIRVDDHDESLQRVFFGGLNVYLNGKIPFWRYIPRFATRWLDHPRVIRWATSRSISNDAHELGELTLSMLRGEHGPHRAAGKELAEFIAKELKPDAVVFSNALLAGTLHELKQHYDGPVLCVLQGDDIFLDGLPDKHRKPVIEMLGSKALEFDCFLTHSRFYRDYMASYLNLPVDRFEQLPLGIDFANYATDLGRYHQQTQQPYTVGYFARIAPEKGLHHLAEGFLKLKQRIPDAKLKIGGYLAEANQYYFAESQRILKSVADDVTYIGSPETLSEKAAFFHGIDTLSVPTDFLEPKGLYVLEAMANGVPVVQPQHGAFPEILSLTQGGILVPPKEPTALANALAELGEHTQRASYGTQGWHNVREHFSLEKMAEQTLAVLESIQRAREKT